MLNADDVIQLYEGWKNALANGSLKALEAICDADFTRTTAEGAVEDRAAVMAGATADEVVYESWTSSAQRVRFYGSTAVLNCRDEIRMLANGRSLALEQRAIAVFFRRDDGAWKLVGTQSTPVSTE